MKKVITENSVKATVVAISWERIFMTLEVAVEGGREDLLFYAVDENGVANARFKQKILDNGHYSLTLNITNQGENKCIAYGDHWIVACEKERPLGVCETGVELVPYLEERSRGFLYSGRKKVFSITFYVSEGEDTLPFRMLVLPAAKTGFGAPTEKLFQRNHTSLKKMINKNRRPFLRALYSHYSKRYRKKSKTVLFMSEQSGKLGGNQTAVIKRMKERGLEGEYTILESMRPAAAEHQSMRSWFTVIKKLAKSTVVVVDDHAPVLDWLTLDERTKLIQLWHAGAGFKSSGYSRWGHEGCPAPHSAHRQYKYGIAGSKNIAPFFSEVWGIKDEQVLATGMPRMDEYLDETYKAAKVQELYKEFPACKGKKVILFAPTYRGRNKRTAYYPYELIDFEKFYKLCGEEYVVLFKMHPWVAKPVPVPESCRDKFIDVNLYPNINDLFYITDLLITDYSSNIFEYSLMGRPMLFFAFDKIQYSFSRGFHRAYEESAPGKVCYTFEELLEAIEKKDFEEEKVKQYVDHHFDYIDTHASDRVIDWLIIGPVPDEVHDALLKEEVANIRMQRTIFEIYDEDLVAEEESDGQEEQTET
ncbi:MAG: CDP-glycerol glycerophosphotransferase family protein [Muribaculaceae bacterium]|nr:CDP-glycerol glycerophosphotransferase family protein [Roseburia sp.]MCM1431815.1 CDP-glycerol glycerophosphotransferase family protein [Muribaculaceae bacterium]MCM1493496.1 CDP-glycerol glycerophosphotransferase family protein [Muribaculaceae bacterium]